MQKRTAGNRCSTCAPTIISAWPIIRGTLVGGGLGISFPLGGSRVSQAYGAETALIDPANGATMWSGRASSSTAQNATGQIAELAQTTVEALQSTGLL